MVMQNANRNTGLTGTTPIGEVIWAQLASPDRKYKSTGEYRVIMRIPEEQAQELVSNIQFVVQDAFKDAEKNCRNPREKENLIRARPSWEPEFDRNTGMETGFVKFRFKANASGVTKDGRDWTLTIPVFDRRGKTMNPVPNVGPGSEVKVAYELFGYKSAALGVGCSCRLKAVQLFKLVQARAKQTAADFGFSSEESDETDMLSPWEENDMQGSDSAMPFGNDTDIPF